MPIESTIDRKKRLVNTVCSGTVTLGDFLKYQDNVWRDESLFGFNELFDTDDGDFSALTISDLQEVAKNASRLNLDPNSRIAIVVHSSKQDGLADMYMVLKQQRPENTRKIQSFLDKQSGLAWLGQD